MDEDLADDHKEPINGPEVENERVSMDKKNSDEPEKEED